MKVSVITCTYNGAWCLERTLRALAEQTLPKSEWELVFVDNASTDGSGELATRLIAELGIRGAVLHEPQPGKTFALQTAFRAAQGEFFCTVDDDNLLASDYLANAAECLAANPGFGLIGGKVLPVMEDPEASLEDACHWTRAMLAVRDFGEDVIAGNAPIGAGMAGRTAVMRGVYESIGTHLPDRIGDGPGCCEDHEKSQTFRRLGWEVAYVPCLSLDHVIPAKRLDPEYIWSIACSAQWAKPWLSVLANPAAHRSRARHLVSASALAACAARYRLAELVGWRGAIQGKSANCWRRFYESRAAGYVALARRFRDVSGHLERIEIAKKSLSPDSFAASPRTESSHSSASRAEVCR
ncbi:N-glycosyltransferase [Posidoniimonas polymericola]|uniref:N-glycosyltransferase n=1 Tax=Posidoniimonas polymericola TaxID=2528002 RepID=A0A5C5ZEW9_9BACT|nr:glycosyltransferase [Posidoniimonas polymericola]TWT85914.1 N-glycosyltransferase [Posidoniimonas polymericola]